MITKEKIIEILQSHSFNVEDQAGNHLIVVDDDSWDAVATEVKNAVKSTDTPSCLGAVVCRLSSPIIKPLDFDGEPLYYKRNGMYGYLMPSGQKVLWFYSDADGGLFYDELEGWSVLYGI